jgi:hypothetical protein
MACAPPARGGPLVGREGFPCRTPRTRGPRKGAYTVLGGVVPGQTRIRGPISAQREVRAMQIVDPQYRPCVECATPGTPNTVLLGFRKAVEVRKRDTGEVVGYLHDGCKDAWARRNGETEFSFRAV